MVVVVELRRRVKEGRQVNVGDVKGRGRDSAIGGVIRDEESVAKAIVGVEERNVREKIRFTGACEMCLKRQLSMDGAVEQL